VTTPDVVGLTQSAAAAALLSVSLTVGAITPVQDPAAAGTVIGQDPAAGEALAAGTAVALTVSTGPGGDALPPDPSSVASPIDPTVPTDFAAAVAFLYDGAVPVQTGADDDALDPHRVAVLRGRVLDGTGAPLPWATVTVPAVPEIGQTLTRSDGAWDLVVNGGGPVVLRFAKDGHLSAQRRIETPWRDYEPVPDVVLLEPDPVVTTVDFSEPVSVAQASLVSDADGERQATLLFPAQAGAQMVMPSGETVPLDEINVRVTEYTVGALGGEAMPAELPPSTAYTYCAEITVDEADAAGAASVTFDEPVVEYLENFLDVPVGASVPVGFYRPDAAAWESSPNGLVVEVLDEVDGLATLDLDGDGLAADAAALEALGVTDAERVRVAELYDPGQTLWRVPLEHFSTCDYNFSWKLPSDAKEPKPKVWEEKKKRKKISKHDCRKIGSVIDVHHQTLGEAIPIPGTAYTLHYQSARSEAPRDRTIRVGIGTDIPESAMEVILRIDVAGQHLEEVWEPLDAPPFYVFEWDGLDGYDRPVQGPQPVVVRVGFRYPSILQPYSGDWPFGSAFQGGGAIVFDVEGRMAAPSSVVLWSRWEGFLGAFRASGLGFGAWSLSHNHVYQRSNRTLYRGDGRDGAAGTVGKVLRHFAGGGASSQPADGDGGPAADAKLFEITDIATGPDGSLYVVDMGHRRIRRVRPDGVIEAFAGTGEEGWAGDGGPATEATFTAPGSIAVGPDGSVYVTDTYSTPDVFYMGVIRRIAPDGTIHRFAGVDAYCNTGWDWNIACNEEVPPLEAEVDSQVFGIAVSDEGRVCWSEWGWDRVRCVGLDGLVRTVAGGDVQCGGWGADPECGDGGPAAEAQLSGPRSLAFGPDGALFLVDETTRIRRIGPDGIITLHAGMYGDQTGAIDGVPATESSIGALDIAVGPDDALYLVNTDPVFLKSVRRIHDGVIHRIAGRKQYCAAGLDCEEGAAALDAELDKITEIAAGPDGILYLVDGAYGGNGNRVSSIEAPFDGLTFLDTMVPAADGLELYVFDVEGRHTATWDAYTGDTVFTFDYDPFGRLASVTDADDRTTEIHRSPEGSPTAIEGPDGHLTTLSTGGDATLDLLVTPDGANHTFSYGPDGLLEDYLDPVLGLHDFTWSGPGYLEKDQDPDGSWLDLTRDVSEDGFMVETTTAAGVENSYQVTALGNGDVVLETSFGCCAANEVVLEGDGMVTTTWADGTVVTETWGPDPRWGMAAPLKVRRVLVTPSGLSHTRTLDRSVYLTDSGDLMSLEDQTDVIEDGERPATVTWDALDRQFTVQTGEWRSVDTWIDEQGRVEAQGIDDMELRTYTWDEDGRLEAETLGEGVAARLTTYVYDDQGNLAAMTDPEDEVWGYGWDASGRLTGITRPDLETVSFAYDLAGRLLSVTPPGRPAHTYGYADGLVQTYSPPAVDGEEATTTFGWDADGQLDMVTFPDGRTLDPVRDPALGGRVASIAIERGLFEFTYDPLGGSLAAATDPDGGAVALEFDGPLHTGTTWTGEVSGAVGMTWEDLTLDPLEETVNGAHSVIWELDDDGLVTQAGDLEVDLDSDAGLPDDTALGDLSSVYTWNGYADLEAQVVSHTGGEIFSGAWTWDKVDRVEQSTVTIEGADVVRDYTYDAAGRLQSVTEGGVQLVSCIYDANGNRTSCADSGGTVTGTTDDRDRMLTWGDVSYGWGPNGDLQSRTDPIGTTTYTYDETHQLLGVVKPDGTDITYVIDGLNRRVGRRVDGVLSHGWLYSDRGHVVAELGPTGEVVSRFVWAYRADVPAYMVKGGDTYRLVSDIRGSVRLVVDAATGVVAQRLDYDPFGKVTLDTAPGFQPFGFAGGLYDPLTGLVRFDARDYDAETGRWTTPDPAGFSGGSPNLYQYAIGDPVNHVDPSGLNHCTQKPRPVEPDVCRTPSSPLSPANWLSEVMRKKGLAKRYMRQREHVDTPAPEDMLPSGKDDALSTGERAQSPDRWESAPRQRVKWERTSIQSDPKSGK